MEAILLAVLIACPDLFPRIFGVLSVKPFPPGPAALVYAAAVSLRLQQRSIDVAGIRSELTASQLIDVPGVGDLLKDLETKHSIDEATAATALREYLGFTGPRNAAAVPTETPASSVPPGSTDEPESPDSETDEPESL